jgi:hypothetical protein
MHQASGACNTPAPELVMREPALNRQWQAKKSASMSMALLHSGGLRAGIVLDARSAELVAQAGEDAALMSRRDADVTANCLACTCAEMPELAASDLRVPLLTDTPAHGSLTLWTQRKKADGIGERVLCRGRIRMDGR